MFHWFCWVKDFAIHFEFVCVSVSDVQYVAGSCFKNDFSRINV